MQKPPKAKPVKGELVVASKTAIASAELDRMPPLLAGHVTKAIQLRAHDFYSGIAELFKRWLARRPSPHTQRAYHDDVMAFVSYVGLAWPRQSHLLLAVSVSDVQAWRDQMLERGQAPKTMNRRVSSLSSFYRYLQGAAAELRLPINVGNPAHAQFIARESGDPVEPTKAISATRARQLMGLPVGEDVLAYRDRAILKFLLYSAARIGTACRLKINDLHHDGDEATIKLHEKGSRGSRTIGLHFAAVEAITQYCQAAELSGTGPLFRPRLNPRSRKLAARAMTEKTMWRIVVSYLAQLPHATVPLLDADEKPILDLDGTPKRVCVYTPHSLRATAATLLLEAGVDISKVRELLGHKNLVTTQIYDKRRRSTSESASHDVPL